MDDLVQGFRDQGCQSPHNGIEYVTASEKPKVSHLPRFPKYSEVLDGCSPMGAGLANSLRVRGNVTNP